MGNYYCKKCYVPLDYHNNIEHSRRFNCRVHSYKNEKCTDCPNKGNIDCCRHKFVFRFICF